MIFSTISLPPHGKTDAFKPDPEAETGKKPTLSELFKRLPPPPEIKGSKPLPHLSELYSALPSTSPLPAPTPSDAFRYPEPDAAASQKAPPVVIDDDPMEVDEIPEPTMFRPVPYVFNTTDDFATRQTKRSWAGSYRAEDWVFQREELHADQVDRDRVLPVLMWDAGYPHFVRILFFALFF